MQGTRLLKQTADDIAVFCIEQENYWYMLPEEVLPQPPQQTVELDVAGILESESSLYSLCLIHSLLILPITYQAQCNSRRVGSSSCSSSTKENHLSTLHV